MTTIKEDYVSFEVAKLLKEKGFDEPCYTCYLDKELSHYEYLSTNFELIDGVISAPTLQMTMKYLREVHNIFIEINGIWVVDYGYNYSARIIVEGETKKLLRYYNYYEDAVKAALKYVLENLI